MLHISNVAPSPAPNHANHLFVLLLVKCVFSICCEPGTVLGVADIWMNKAHFHTKECIVYWDFLPRHYLITKRFITL